MFSLDQVYQWEDMHEWEAAGQTGCLNGVEVLTGERPTMASLGGNPDATVGAVVKNDELGEYTVTFAHNVDWLAPTQDDINKSKQVFTTVKIDQKKFVEKRTLSIKRPIKFYGTSLEDFHFIKGKPSLLVNYNFETIKNIKSFDTIESYKAIASDLLDDKMKMQEKLRKMCEDMQVKIVY